MDQAEFDRLLSNLPAVKPKGDAPAKGAAPQAASTPGQMLDAALGTGATPPAEGGSMLDDPAVREAVGSEAVGGGEADDQSLAPAGTPDAVEGAMTGALKGVFETKDFLFGESKPEEWSNFRKTVEARDKQLDERSMLSGFSSGIGQFAIGMIGLGKLKVAGKVARTALEMGKAAVVGAVAFDPHEERLSNLVQGTPLANPINAWLAADPNDSAAEGRIKSALESVALDGAIIGTFMLSTKILKALRNGNTEEAAKLADQLQKEAASAQAPEATAADPLGETALVPEGAQGAGPDLQAGATASPNAQAQEALNEPVDAGGVGGATPPPQQAGEEALGGPSGGALPDPEVNAQVVANPTEAAAKADTELMSPNARIRFTDENTDEVLAGMEADAKAMEEHGGWDEAIEAGHTFGKGDKVPWVKLNNDASLDDFMARVVDASEERLDKLKGGKVLSDEKVSKLVDARVALYDEDPAVLLGLIQNSGKNAARMVADMEAGYLVSNKMMQDAFALATKYRLGDYSEFGTKEAMQEALRQRLSVAASVYGAARSITANAGRGVRRMRGQFKIDPAMVDKLATMDPDLLSELIVVTKGNPRAMAKLAGGTWTDKVADFGQFLLINNLVSGPKTHLVNILSNSYMVAGRPMERILGSVVPAVAGNKASRQILRESVKQYAYMGTAFADGFSLAAKAFLYGDSTLSPHNTELWKGAGRSSMNLVEGWKPMDSIHGVLSNALKVGTGIISVPTRTLGSVDELVKQTVYRSKVMANAHVEAVEMAATKGLKGKAGKDFIKQSVMDKLNKAFDVEGRGIDPVSLREANIATFQQDLLPATLGKAVSTTVNNLPGLRLVLPFVKTPTNVIRYGWKLSPGLNLLQREYKAMLLGKMGAEAQAQATGQMAMGLAFMGTAAYMVSNGAFTGGGGDSTYAEMASLKATGWQPYSVVFENDDGSKTYIPFGRLDPLVIPFGIIADLQDALHILDGEETPEMSAAIGGLLMAMSRQFTSKTYLQGLDGAIEALNDKEAAGRWLKQTTANFIPFSAAQRQWNQDPYLREARDITDQLLATIPGLSEKVPAKYDWLGEPMLARKGLWSNAEDDIVDLEVQRLVLEGGSTVAKPSPYHGGLDLRDITMESGKNAYEEYQKMAGRPNPKGLTLRKAVQRVMSTEAYKKAPDGDIATKGTKLWLLHPTISRFRSAAMKRLKADPRVREALMKKQMKVVDHYKGQRTAPQAKPAPNLGEVGKAFGVQLDALFKQ